MHTVQLLLLAAIVASVSTLQYKSEPLKEYRVYTPLHERTSLPTHDKHSFKILKETEHYIHVLASRRTVRVLKRNWRVETTKRHQESKYSNEAIYTTFVGLTTQYPSQTNLLSLGKSVNNQDIWLLKITGTEPTDPEKKKQKPHVLFVANMNGTDTLGRDLLVDFAKRLLFRADYDDGERVRNVLKSAHVYIVPTLNPDGFDLGTSENANGVDLYSDFKNLIPSDSAQGGALQPETEHLMTMTQIIGYTLSTNFRNGDIILYPYMDCGTTCPPAGHAYNETPDELVFRHLSDEYAARNPNMTEAILGHKPTANGANWAPVKNSFSDWIYRYRDCMDISVGINENGQTDASILADNEESMLNFIETASRGVRGTVRTNQGKALEGVSLTLSGNTHETKTSLGGEFFRVLLPGEYTLTANVPGYHPLTKSFTVPATTATPNYVTVFFALTPTSTPPTGAVTNFPHVVEPCRTNLQAMLQNTALQHEIQTYAAELGDCVSSKQQEIVQQAVAGKTNISLSCTDKQQRFDSACKSAKGQYCNAYTHIASTNPLLPINAYVQLHFCLPKSCETDANIASIEAYVNNMEQLKKRCPEAFKCEIIIDCVASNSSPDDPSTPTTRPPTTAAPFFDSPAPPAATIEPSTGQIVPTARFSGREIFIFTTVFIAFILIAVIVGVSVAYRMSDRFRNFMKHTVGIGGGDENDIDFEEYDIVPLNENEPVPLDD